MVSFIENPLFMDHTVYIVGLTNDIKIGMPSPCTVCNTVVLFLSCSAQKTITCGAAIKTAAESST